MSKSDKLTEKWNIKQNGLPSVAAGHRTQQGSFVTCSSSFCGPDDQTVLVVGVRYEKHHMMLRLAPCYYV